MYTVGECSVYDSALMDANNTVFKSGASGDYPGGIVFASVSDSVAYILSVGCSETWGVYLLDTVSSDKVVKFGNELRLLAPCPIIKRVL